MTACVVVIDRVNWSASWAFAGHLPPHWLADTEFFWEGTFLLACVNTTIVIALRYAPGANSWFEKKK